MCSLSREHDIKMKVVLAQLIHVIVRFKTNAAVFNALIRASFATIGLLCAILQKDLHVEEIHAKYRVHVTPERPKTEEF